MVNRCVTLLFIGAVSEPKLSVVPSESGGVTLHCEATCWLPEPEIQFLDHQGNNITADNENRTQDASGCYTVTRRVTLQDATHRFTFTSSFKLRLIFYKRPFVAPSLKLSCPLSYKTYPRRFGFSPSSETFSSSASFISNPVQNHGKRRCSLDAASGF